tara:strand:- start:13733 stop:14470 length:738 start_codon:yes stop_codon:yes gene_type:complete
MTTKANRSTVIALGVLSALSLVAVIVLAALYGSRLMYKQIPRGLMADRVTNPKYPVLHGFDVMDARSKGEGLIKDCIGVAKYSASYSGYTFFFKTDENLQNFQAEPSKYAPEFGGFCAWSVSEESWKIALFVDVGLDAQTYALPPLASGYFTVSTDDRLFCFNGEGSKKDFEQTYNNNSLIQQNFVMFVPKATKQERIVAAENIWQANLEGLGVASPIFATSNLALCSATPYFDARDTCGLYPPE